jgi:hypothetical protein
MVPEKTVDAQALAATLAYKYDVFYLRTAEETASLSLDPPDLIAALAQHSEPRLHEALIPLFLRNPEFAIYVPDLVEQLPSKAGQKLSHLYTAAVYLQHLWRTKLEMYLGPQPALPNHFGESEWNLPSPDEHFGEAGLRILAEKLRTETGVNWLSAYKSIISLFLYQLRLIVHG